MSLPLDWSFGTEDRFTALPQSGTSGQVPLRLAGSAIQATDASVGGAELPGDDPAQCGDGHNGDQTHEQRSALSASMDQSSGDDVLMVRVLNHLFYPLMVSCV